MQVCSSSSLSCFLLIALLSLLFSNNIKSCYSDRVDSHKSTEFIKVSCKVTKYPHLCFDSLAVYASTIQTSPIQLADAALLVTLTSVRSASAALSRILAHQSMKPIERVAMKDCVENIADSVDEVKKSLVELRKLGGPDFEYHMSNLQTWVSAVLTNEESCVDGFAEKDMKGHIKNAVRSCIVNGAELTSNALALINHLASNQPASP